MKKMVSVILLVVGLLVTSALFVGSLGAKSTLKPVNEVEHHELGIGDLGDPPFPPFTVSIR